MRNISVGNMLQHQTSQRLLMQKQLKSYILKCAVGWWICFLVNSNHLFDKEVLLINFKVSFNSNFQQLKS